jgi:hypothetical protein
MIETILMMISLLVLGYSFYISTRMFLIFRSGRGKWGWLYGLVSVFVISVFFLFAITMFSFFTLSMISQSLINLLNVIIAIFFLASSGLVWAVMRYHVSLIRSTKGRDKISETTFKKISMEKKRLEKRVSSLEKKLDKEKIKKPGSNDKSKEDLIKEIEHLENEATEAKKLSNLAVGRELKIIEMRKKIERLERGK